MTKLTMEQVFVVVFTAAALGMIGFLVALFTGSI